MTGRFGKIAIVALASLLIGLLAGVFVLQQKRIDAHNEVEAAHGELEVALATLSVRMAGIANALERAPAVSPTLYAEFYADATRSATRTPERAVAYMPEIGTPETVEAAIRHHAGEYAQIGYPEFRLFPEAPADTLFPVILVEPEASRANVFGYNMGSSPERLAAAREALEKGVMTTSAPVALSQDADRARASFLLLYPVYFDRPEVATGARQAVLGAGMTPSALFGNHLGVHARHIVEIEIGIGGVDLPVTLVGERVGIGPRLPLLTEERLPPIRTAGFDVPFMASVFYVPRLIDGVPSVLAAVLAALIGWLALNLTEARAASHRALEQALARKEAELREAYRLQARFQRIEALGRLVAGVAHDFNNILSVILGNLELMREEGKASAGEPLIDEAIAATQRGAHLTRQLLAAGRKSHLQPRRIDAAEALHESAAMLRRVLPESIDLVTVPAAGLWRIEVDPDGLQNAILNLAINARDAMQGRGKLTLEAANTRATHDYLEERPEEDLTPGRYVVFSVSDTGPGMPPEVADRAFEPFFTTKHATEGSGLGLPSVLGFCRQSGGTCRIYSEPHKGTSIRMFFPAHEAGPLVDPDHTAVPAPAEGALRILLAEDEISVARVVVRQLEGAGHAVHRVPSGDAAWAELERGTVFDLLITDVVMPGRLQGAELARRVEAAHPDLPILLISGYPQEAAIEGNGVAERHPVLTKPIPASDLLRMIERLSKA